MENQVTHKVQLIAGYTDKKGVLHRDVTFGNRLKLKKMLELSNRHEAAIPTQRELLLVAASITAFGTMKMPLPLPVLLELDSIDADDLQAAHDEFLSISRGDGKGTVVSDTETRLGVGIEIDNRKYTFVTFGRRLTRKDTVEAESKGLTGMAKALFESVAQIEKLTCEETGEELTAPFETAVFDNLDLEDFDFLFAGGERFRQSFRKNREEAAREQDSSNGVHSDEGNRDEQGGDSESAG